jgi:hypothetical protein
MKSAQIKDIQMSGDLMSLLQDLIPEAVPSRKCHTDIGLILNDY